MKKLKSRQGISSARIGGAPPFSKRQIVVSLFLVSAIGTVHALDINDGDTKTQADISTDDKPSVLDFKGTVPAEDDDPVTAVFKVEKNDYAFTGIGGPDTYLNLSSGKAGMILVDQDTTLTFSDATTRVININGGSRLDLIAETKKGLVFDNNKNTNPGGAIYNTGTLNIENAVFAVNSTSGDQHRGGAIYSDGTLNIENAVFTGNSTTGSASAGGAIFNDKGTLNIENAVFAGNFTDGLNSSGGAIYNTGTLNITNARFTSNTATNRTGGAVCLDTHTATIRYAIFKDNSAAAGGAIFGFGHSGLGISNAIFKDNSAIALAGISGAGGAINNSGATIVTNSIFSGNSATGDGGAIYGMDNITLTNVSFFNNTTNSAGAAIYASADTKFFILNVSEGMTSIFSGNLKAINDTPSANSIFLSGSYFGNVIPFTIEIEEGGTLDMRDPMGSIGKVAITKTGTGQWRLGGTNTLYQGNYKPTFAFNKGELYLYAEGEVGNANKNYESTRDAKVGAAVLNLGEGTFTLGDGTNRTTLTVSGENAINVSGAGQITFANHSLIQAGDYQKETHLTLGSETNNPVLDGEVTFSVADEDATLTINGKLGDSSNPGNLGSLIKEGLGTLRLNDENEYSGNTTVEKGKLILGTPGAIAASGVVTVKNDAILQLLPDNNGSGQTQTLQNLTHSGLVDFGLGNLNNTLLIKGNLIGQGGTFRLDTQMNGDGSLTDKIVIKGNVTGYSLLQVTPTRDSTFARFDKGLQLVQLLGEGDKPYAGTVEQGQNAFALANDGAIGAYQYLLDYQAGNGWFLVNTPLYSPGAVNTVTAQAANAEQGFLQLINLHQRVEEFRNLRPELQTWAKTYYFQLKNDGKRQFGFDQKTNGIQVGHEFLAEATESGGSVRAALAIDYASSRTDFEDRERPQLNLSADTGKMEASNTALGGYITRTTENGAYVDLVGQVAWLRNKFQDSSGDKATQKGWLAGISAEGGVPLWTAGEEKEWLLEGQAQLIYQYAKYGSFHNSASRFEKYSADSLRGRLGLRLVHSMKTTQDKTLQVYGLFNMVHDFLDPEALRVGDNGGNYVQVSESYNKSYGELGFGVDGYVSKSTTLFGDFRYQQSFSNGSGERKGRSFNLGVRFQF